MTRLIDLTGRKFGYWTVLAIHPERKRYGKTRRAVVALWMCRCVCDTERLVLGTNLRRGLSLSCGCLSREKTRKRNFKHGHARRGQHTRVYDAWQHAKQRCNNSNNRDYGNYGARGICVECRNFEEFHTAAGDAPPGKLLDRIDNDGNYKAGNMRWATPLVQRHNQRRHKQKRKRAKLRDIEVYAARITRAASNGARTAP
jgi:hypothetical protein